MKRDEKAAVVERLADADQGAKALIVTDYRGLTVTQTAELRDALREAGACSTWPRTRWRGWRPSRPSGRTLVEFLEGPTAIAFIADDPAPAAKPLSEVARSTRILAVKGGVMNGHTLTADQVRALGDLPPREVLLSQVVGAVAGPLQATVRRARRAAARHRRACWTPTSQNAKRQKLPRERRNDRWLSTRSLKS